MTPREIGGPEGVETLGAPTASQYRRWEDGRGWGGGDKNPPTARPNWEHPTDGGYRAAPRGAAAMEDAEAGTEQRTSGAGHPKAPPHWRGFGRSGGRPSQRVPYQPRRRSKRRQVISSIPYRQGSGCTGGRPSEHEAGAVNWSHTEDGEGGRNPTENAQEEDTDDEATEESPHPPPKPSQAPNASGRRGGGRERGHPHPAARAQGAQRGSGRGREAQRGNLL